MKQSKLEDFIQITIGIPLALGILYLLYRVMYG